MSGGVRCGVAFGGLGAPGGQSLWETCRSALWDPPTGGACSGLHPASCCLTQAHTTPKVKWDCLIPGSTPSPFGTWFPRACRTSWGIRELTSQSSGGSTWAVGEPGHKESHQAHSFLPHTLRARAVPALRTVIRTGTVAPSRRVA